MTITHPHGHPDLAGRLTRIEQRGARHRLAAVVICFCLPALAAACVAVGAVLSPVWPAGSPAHGATTVEAVAP